jgi:late control gene D protein (GPD)
VPQLKATIRIDDADAGDLFISLIEMTVEEDHRLAAMFRIRLGMQRGPDGLWEFLDDERIKPWSKVVIAASADEEETELITGYITQITPHVDPDESNCYLEIYGLDGSSLMSIEEKIKDWPKKSDSDIARQIFTDHYLTPEVEDTAVIHDEPVSTIIQRETDIQFLKRLARRNGFECFVKGETGFFRKPALTESPRPVLAAHFGAESNLISFDARLNALRPTAVEMHQIDTIGKEIQDAAAESNEQERLGRDGASSLEPPNGLASRLFIRHALATGQPEMENLCRAIFDEAEWLIEARGQIESSIYGAVLQARTLAPIKGVGEVFSGMYYITNVRHVFTAENYRQHFTARRNAMGPVDGDFSGGDSLPGGLL